MNSMNKTMRLPMALTFGMAILSISPLAIAQPTSLELQDTAQYIARGAGAIVSVEVACAETTTQTDLSVRLTQRVGGRLVVGFGDVEGFVCSSDPTVFEVLVTPNEEGNRNRPFKTGAAAANAALFACGPGGTCSQISDPEPITLVK